MSSNSVLSEHSFSILKLLQNKLHSRLIYNHVDQLQYIYINERVLARALTDNKLSSLIKKNEKSFMKLEDILIANDENQENNSSLI